MEYTKEETEKYEEMKLFFKNSKKEQRQEQRKKSMMEIPFFKDQIEKKAKDELYDVCGCGSVIKNGYMNKHMLSKKHQKITMLQNNGEFDNAAAYNKTKDDPRLAYKKLTPVDNNIS